MLKTNIEQRLKQGLDVSEADLQVLADQIQHQQPLDERETRLSITVSTSRMDELVQAISVRKKENISASCPDLETGLI